MLKRHRFALSAAILAAILVSGCGTGSVDKSEVEKQAREQLTKTVGQQAPPIKCPGDLDSEVGAKLTCSLTDSGKTYDVAIEVTKVKDGRATFGIKVANEPR